MSPENREVYMCSVLKRSFISLILIEIIAHFKFWCY